MRSEGAGRSSKAGVPRQMDGQSLWQCLTNAGVPRQIHCAECADSQSGLKVRPHRFLHATDSSKLNQLSGFGLHAFTIEFERFEHCVHTNFVSIFETICQCFLGTVYPNHRVLDRVLLYTGREGIAGKPIDLYWWKSQTRRLSTSVNRN